MNVDYVGYQHAMLVLMRHILAEQALQSGEEPMQWLSNFKGRVVQDIKGTSGPSEQDELAVIPVSLAVIDDVFADVM
ncbi:hypothetical protein I6F35_32080 [Bradyrhizobium sp. BRP22]|uniref:hypothetical protein n=1 Tax=Bradyrhizobium sp. BRP22 TaxID=2793821 RepID=UPI001CD5F071|nr:hypothetical protein [Bradyrhizobium sp. BRP22]MCA1457770.1 hypothetical protein [Bradyrhizobium sp. BRP22]